VSAAVPQSSVAEAIGVSKRFGATVALHDVGITVAPGEAHALVGRNGAGKSTLLRCVMGLHPGRRGTVSFDGRDLGSLPAHRRARLGLGWVPDDRGAYATLSVTEHLTLPPAVGPQPWSLDRIYEAFPVLHERRASAATQLSGGEQQMLALARVLRMGARLLLCDEPTEGLAPLLVARVADILRQVREQGTAVLLVEQNLRFATGVADRHHLLAEGRVVETLRNDEVREREGELLAYLGI
jgi:branched-chain amino acid transport system ATP-binding protein